MEQLSFISKKQENERKRTGKQWQRRWWFDDGYYLYMNENNNKMKCEKQKRHSQWNDCGDSGIRVETDDHSEFPLNTQARTQYKNSSSFHFFTLDIMPDI